MYRKGNSSIACKSGINSFKRMVPLARMFPLAVMHTGLFSYFLTHLAFLNGIILSVCDVCVSFGHLQDFYQYSYFTEGAYRS